MLGSGADEQFGGYVRHKNLLRRNNWSELQTQLLKETLFISKRNLGRDDRIACDSGRQPRFPFLDESVVEFVAGLPPWKKLVHLRFYLFFSIYWGGGVSVVEVFGKKLG